MIENANMKCFGKWSFEDMGCMQCTHESDCSANKRENELAYKRTIKDFRCWNCSDIIKCNQTIKNCFGFINRTCDNRCKCWYECQRNQYLISIKVECIKPIIMKTEHYEPYNFIEGNTYIFSITKDGMLLSGGTYYDIILGRKKPYNKLNIFDKYFKIIE